MLTRFLYFVAVAAALLLLLLVEKTTAQSYSFSYEDTEPYAVADTVMFIQAGENPTEQHELDLKATIAEETGVPIRNIHDFEILSEEVPASRRRLTGDRFEWTVSFQVTVLVTQTDCRCGTSSVDFAIFVQTTCASPQFNAKYQRHCRTCEVDKSSVKTEPCYNCPRPPPKPCPCPQPTPKPPKPTPKPPKPKPPSTPKPPPTPKPSSTPKPLPTPKPPTLPECPTACSCPAPTPVKPPKCKTQNERTIPENVQAKLKCKVGVIRITRSRYGVCDDDNGRDVDDDDDDNVGGDEDVDDDDDDNVGGDDDVDDDDDDDKSFPPKCTDTTSILRRPCNGEKTCTVHANNKAMGGDPSPGDPKALFIEYCCWDI